VEGCFLHKLISGQPAEQPEQVLVLVAPDEKISIALATDALALGFRSVDPRRVVGQRLVFAGTGFDINRPTVRQHDVAAEPLRTDAFTAEIGVGEDLTQHPVDIPASAPQRAI
jgi:hypothetical protein